MYAQQNPTQDWVSGWLDFLQANLPVIHWSAGFIVAILAMIRKGNQKKRIMGGIQAAIVSGIAAFACLTPDQRSRVRGPVR